MLSHIVIALDANSPQARELLARSCLVACALKPTSYGLHKTACPKLGESGVWTRFVTL